MDSRTVTTSAHELATRAATVDELLSDDFESAPGHKPDNDLAAKRLAAWCESSSNGDWALFEQRLRRDGHTTADVLTRFATARRRPSASVPQWARDSQWIQAGLLGSPIGGRGRDPFEQIFSALVDEADTRLWESVEASTARRFAHSARDDLRRLLIGRLCGLCAPILYDRFSQASAPYEAFVADMTSGGMIGILKEKPVLLRLVACVVRQWLTTMGEFLIRLDADFERIHHRLLRCDGNTEVAHVRGGLSDLHRGGRSVLRVEFDDESCAVYKPRDLRLDAVWQSLVQRLNHDAPVDLRAVRVIPADGYGWAECIEHTSCKTELDCQMFFRRAGAWLALFHCFAASDIHHENMIAAGDHPVPIDIETLLQGTPTDVRSAPAESQAYEAAREVIANSVASIGLLPSYGKSANGVRAAGGVATEWPVGKALVWNDVNTDAMRPAVVPGSARPPTNLPRIGAERYVGLADHLDDFVGGFRDYAAYLRGVSPRLFDGFATLPVRKVIRPSQFYSMLVHRLSDDRTMQDGVLWSSQADFLARLSDWNSDSDADRARQCAERSALVQLNVPIFTTLTDGVQRGQDRIKKLDDPEIAWQVDVIRQTSPDLSGVRPRGGEPAVLPTDRTVPLPKSSFWREADTIAEQIAECAMRGGSGAAWIGLDWFADSEVSQLAVLGHDLYNGSCGIATFLAAHAHVTASPGSAELAKAAIARLVAELRSQRGPHVGRVMGIGGATGLGSIVYGVTCISRLLDDDSLIEDALGVARLISDDLIAADSQLDVVGGSAGAILGLLRLYRDTGDDEVLARGVACGAHLLSRPRRGPRGGTSWPSRTSDKALNGMSHGAAGFAYALAALATVSGRDDFAEAATECLNFERRNFDAQRSDWPDLRVAEPHWRSQWCHGAVGIGLARLGITKLGFLGHEAVSADIEAALTGASRGWPAHADTLCCGALGSVELAREASTVLSRYDLGQLASQRLSAVLRAKAAAGGYRWSTNVSSRLNVGLFRGLAGVGYTCLREGDGSLPNLLIWE